MKRHGSSHRRTHKPSATTDDAPLFLISDDRTDCKLFLAPTILRAPKKRKNSWLKKKMRYRT